MVSMTPLCISYCVVGKIPQSDSRSLRISEWPDGLIVRRPGRKAGIGIKEGGRAEAPYRRSASMLTFPEIKNQ